MPTDVIDVHNSSRIRHHNGIATNFNWHSGFASHAKIKRTNAFNFFCMFSSFQIFCSKLKYENNVEFDVGENR